MNVMTDQSRPHGVQQPVPETGSGPEGRTPGRPHWSAHRVGVLASVAGAALWLILAWRSPGSTHHFAPLVIAGVWGYLVRNSGLVQPRPVDRVVMLVGGLAAAIVPLLVLAGADRLQGPPLIAAVPVPVELPLMAVLGAAVGSRPWLLRSPGHVDA